MLCNVDSLSISLELKSSLSHEANKSSLEKKSSAERKNSTKVHRTRCRPMKNSHTWAPKLLRNTFEIHAQSDGYGNLNLILRDNKKMANRIFFFARFDICGNDRWKGRESCWLSRAVDFFSWGRNLFSVSCNEPLLSIACANTTELYFFLSCSSPKKTFYFFKKFLSTKNKSGQGMNHFSFIFDRVLPHGLAVKVEFITWFWRKGNWLRL